MLKINLKEPVSDIKFFDRKKLLTSKLLSEKIVSTFKSSVVRHHYLVEPYNEALSYSRFDDLSQRIVRFQIPYFHILTHLFNRYSRTLMAQTLMAHLPWLFRTLS